MCRCDTLQNATSGVSVATGADWSPPSPFDYARTFATGAIGRYVKNPSSPKKTISSHRHFVDKPEKDGGGT